MYKGVGTSDTGNVCVISVSAHCGLNIGKFNLCDQVLGVSQRKNSILLCCKERDRDQLCHFESQMSSTDFSIYITNFYSHKF